MTIANRKVGQYKLYSVSVTNYTKKTVDIKSSMVNFNIQLDIFNTTMHGELRIKDSNDFVQNLPLIGEELLNITFKKDNSSEKVSLLFYIYSLTDKIKIAENEFEYVLNFCSVELLRNRSTFISESFTNIESSNMIEKLLNKISTKKLFTEETSSKINYIAPNITPFEVINYISSRSISKTYPNSGSFLFYENFDGFNFRTIDSMVKGNVKDTYNFNHKTFTNTNIDSELYTINKWKINQHFDILDNLNKAGYGLTTKVLNPFTRKYDSKTFNVTDENTYNNFARLDDNYKHALHDKKTFLFNDSANNITKFRMSYNDFNKEHILGQRYVQLNQISNNYSVIVQVPGNLNITVGDLINLDYKNHSIDKRSTDLYLSGKYLITAMKYHCTTTEFHMVLEIVKDSYNSNHEEYNRIPLIKS